MRLLDQRSPDMRHLQVIKIDTDVGGLVAYVNVEVTAFGNLQAGELVNPEFPAAACLFVAGTRVAKLLVKKYPGYVGFRPADVPGLVAQEMRGIHK